MQKNGSVSPMSALMEAKLRLLQATSYSRMNLIEEKLWLGDRSAALDCDYLDKYGICSTLTVDIEPLPVNEKYNQMFIQAHDVPTQDLMEFFPAVFDFLERGKEKGHILVHCFQGVSRSATLLMSYLMKKHLISADEALERLQTARPGVQPNEGFMAQLRLYEQLLKCGQTDGIVTRWYNLQRMAKAVSKYLQPSSMDAYLQSSSSSKPALKCKQCRCVLADADDVICHRTGESPSWKDPTWVQFAFNGDRNQSCHQSYFLIPPLWMLEQCDGNSRLEGKLQCPKCSSKLGAFDWKKSLPCPCGATFRPAFYFTASRVDPLKN